MAAYEETSPITIVGDGTNPGLVNFSDGTFSVLVQAPVGLAGNVDFTLPTVDGATGQILMRTGATATEFQDAPAPNIFRTIPINLRFNDPSGNPTTVTSTTYNTLSTVIFNGTTLGDNISAICAVANTTNGSAAGQIRVIDFSNSGAIVAESPIFSHETKDIQCLTLLGQTVDSRVVRDGSIPIGEQITCTNIALGNVTDASGTGFTAPFLITQEDGDANIPEYVFIDLNSATPAGVNGTWFAIYFGAATTDYFFFWYDTDDSGTPQPANPLATGGAEVIVEITTVNTGDSTATIAIKTSFAVNTAASTGVNIENLPTGPALLEIQMRRANAGGGGAAALHSVQMFG